MKTKSVFLFCASAVLFASSCKKESTPKPQISFASNTAEGTANASGEYTLAGHISSQVSLAKVTLTKQGQSTVFMSDESTAKNKNEYDFSYLVTGINSSTTVIIDAYDQQGGQSSSQFVIKK